MAIKLAKTEPVQLQKSVVEPVMLAKGLGGVQAHVALVLDDSFSMEALYANGQVQNVADRALALAGAMSPDRAVEVFQLNRTPYVGRMDFGDHAGWIAKHVWVKGATPYAPVIRDVVKRLGGEPAPEPPPPKRPGLIEGLFGRKPASPFLGPPADRHATYVLFITDGAAEDEAATTQAMIDASRHPIFFQFVGIGMARFALLERLDDMRGRAVDNADFVRMPPEGMSEEALYKSLLLNEFVGWHMRVRELGWVK